MDAHSMSYGERVNDDDDGNERLTGNAKVEGAAMEQCFVRGLTLVTTATSTGSLTVSSVKGHLNGEEDPASAQQPGKRLIERDNKCKGGKTKDQGNVEIGECGVIGYSKQSGSKPASPSPIRMSKGKLQCDVCGMICIGPNVLMVHKRSHTGERPFKCDQCGASFTQKGNLLRHTKLHSGEKPFKCPFCKYACRRRDALTGHIRTHSGKESLVLEPIIEPVLQPTSKKLALVDRVGHNIGKRKRSTPQKFLGEKHMQVHVLEAHFELSPGSDLEQDLLSSPLTGDLAGSAGKSRFPQLGSRGAAENPEPSKMSVTQPTCNLSELPLVFSSVFRHVAPKGVTDKSVGESELPAGWEMREGQEAMSLTQINTVHTSPSNGSLDTKRTAMEQCIGAAVSSNSNHNHVLLYSTPILPRCQKSTTHAKDSERQEPEWDRTRAPRLPYAMLRRHSGSPPSSKETVQVVDAKGQVVHSFRCEHCHILFVDHVMFTIHMGCHGFHQPFECNICGYCSVDRYEFASHISRGEHDMVERRGGLCVGWCQNGCD